MNRFIFQLFISLSLFFSSVYLISSLNWIKVFKIKEIQVSTEKKIGDLIWKTTHEMGNEINSKQAKITLDSLVAKICISNNINPNKIKVHLIEKNEDNAFALPDNHLVIYSSLIIHCKDESELAGVLAHEIAHMELHHVMKKIVKEIGVSALLSATGNTNPIIFQKAVRLLSSSAYDRSLESDADNKAVEYLQQAKINPLGLASFLMKLEKNNMHNITNKFEVINSHPNSYTRAKAIKIKIALKKTESIQVLHSETWDKLKQNMSNDL
jgi:predicted Zn-dependent protease